MGTVSTLRAPRTSSAQIAVAQGISASEQYERLAAANLRFAFAWQRVFLRTALAFVVMSGLSGCSTLDLVGTAVTRYCGATVPAEREVIRARVNERIQPNEIHITCAP